jgi:hypothetical protein
VPGGDRPVVQWMLIAAGIVIVVLAALLIQRQRQDRATIGALQAAVRDLTGQHEELERQLARERAAREAFQIGLGRERTINAPVAVALQPGLDRSGSLTQLRIPKDLPRITLVLPLAASYDRYRAALRDFTSGDELWSHARLRPEAGSKRLDLVLPAEVLVSGRYELVLSGIDRDGTPGEAAVFVFEVVR